MHQSAVRHNADTVFTVPLALWTTLLGTSLRWNQPQGFLPNNGGISADVVHAIALLAVQRLLECCPRWISVIIVKSEPGSIMKINIAPPARRE